MNGHLEFQAKFKYYLTEGIDTNSYKIILFLIYSYSYNLTYIFIYF